MTLSSRIREGDWHTSSMGGTVVLDVPDPGIGPDDDRRITGMIAQVGDPAAAMAWAKLLAAIPEMVAALLQAENEAPIEHGGHAAGAALRKAGLIQ